MKLLLYLLLFLVLMVSVDAFSLPKSLRATSLQLGARTPFFLNNDEEPKKKKPTPPKTPPPPLQQKKRNMAPRPTISLQPMLNELKKEIVDPLLSGDIEKGVSPDAIKGAALTGGALTLLAGQSLALSTTAGLGAAYVALSPGLGGKVVRQVGGAAWTSATAALELYEKYGLGEKLERATKNVMEETMKLLAEQQQQQQQPTHGFEEVKVDVSIPYDAPARLAFQETGLAEEEYPAWKISWEIQQVADVKRKVKATKKAQDKKKATELKKQQQAQAKKEQEERLAAERAQAKKDADARKKAEEQAEKAEQMRKEDEARLAEESRKREEARLEEEAKLKGDIAVEEDDDLQATIRLAEQILDGTIAGLDDAIADTNAKEEWDSAGRLAQDLEGKSSDEEEEDVDELSDEEDMAVLAQAAREAVEKFEEELKSQDATKAKQRALWDNEMVTDEEFDYDEDLEELREEYDEEEDEDMEELEVGLGGGGGTVDLEELGRQARAAVEQFESGDTQESDDIGKAAREAVAKFNAQEADPDDNDVLTDWSKFTVAQLKDELKSRGLKTTGKKAELVAILTSDDFESQVQQDASGEGVMWDADLVEEPTMEDIAESSSDEPDMEEMARAAREAVEMFEQEDADESDMEEMARAAREAVEMFEQEQIDSNVEYEAMTVNELKDELRNRGLKISGRKAELIERLRGSS